jgi:hypothetical protein
MTQAGAKPMSWISVTAEWAPDYTSPERAAIIPFASKQGGFTGS